MSSLTPPSFIPVLLDFGLMSQFSASELSREVLDVSGLASGTLVYIAPEQARGEFVDARADLYSLGCILYELVCGSPPFFDLNPHRLVAKHLFTPPRPPSQWIEGVPPALETLILRLLAKDPRHRLGYATDVAAALEKLGAGEEAAADLPQPRPYLYRSGFGGRKTELDRLLQQLDRLQASPSQVQSPVLLVGGESGIGKTRLAMEFARKAAESEVQVLVGECLQGGTGALYPLRKPLQAIGDRCREIGPAETERLLGAHGKVLAEFEPSLAGLNGLVQHPEPARLHSSAALDRLYSALLDTFSALAARQPLLLLLDDLQWSDELTTGFIEFCLREGTKSWNFLLLGTYRTEEVTAALQRLREKPDVLQIELHRFEQSTVASMVQDMLALEAAPPVFSLHLARQSEGNAFFVAEYLRAAVAEGLLSRDRDGVWQVAEPEGAAEQTASPELMYQRLPLPASLRDLVGRRLEALSAPALRVLQSAAVLGREADEEVLLPMTGLEGNAALDAFAELMARQVFEPGGAGRLRFLHDKIREVAYQRIPAEQRPALHRAAALALQARPDAPPATLGYHWEHAAEPDRARSHYLEALVQGFRQHSPQVAEAHYLTYLRLSPQPTAELVEMRLRWGYAIRLDTSDYARAIEDQTETLGLARQIENPLFQSMALNHLGMLYNLTGQSETAAPLLEQALSIARRIANRTQESTVLINLALLRHSQGRLEQAQLLSEQALATFEELGDLYFRNLLTGNLATIYQERGQIERALEMYQKALTRHRESGTRREEGVVLTELGELRRWQGQLRQSSTLLEQGVEIARQVVNLRNEMFGLLELGTLRLDQGRPEEARTCFQQGLAMALQTSDQAAETQALSGLGAVHLQLDQLEEALRISQQALQIARAMGQPRPQCILLGLQGGIRLRQGLVEEAESLLRQAHQSACQIDLKLHEGILLSRLGGLMLLTSPSTGPALELLKQGEAPSVPIKAETLWC